MKNIENEREISRAISFNQSVAIVLGLTILLDIAQVFGLFISGATTILGFLALYYAIRAHSNSHKIGASFLGSLCVYALNLVAIVGIILSNQSSRALLLIAVVLLLVNYILTILGLIFCYRTASAIRKKYPDVEVNNASIFKKFTKK